MWNPQVILEKGFQLTSMWKTNGTPIANPWKTHGKRHGKPRFEALSRLAARFNAIVVPFGGIGSADNVRCQGRGVLKGFE